MDSPIRLKHDPRRQLNRSGPARPEHLGGAGARQTVVRLVQHTAEAGQVGNVEEVEYLSNQRQPYALADFDCSCQAHVLGQEAVAIGEALRQT